MNPPGQLQPSTPTQRPAPFVRLALSSGSWLEGGPRGTGKGVAATPLSESETHLLCSARQDGAEGDPLLTIRRRHLLRQGLSTGSAG